MATPEDLDRCARSLPEVAVGPYWGQPAYLVGGKAFVWQRPPRRDEGAIDPETGMPFADLIVLRFPERAEREAILATSDPEVVFTIPHFRGGFGVLAHLDRLSDDLLEELVERAWLATAPPPVRRRAPG
ncbi:MAG: MmcQ/YjbR family DNA-binding protein [Dermatophilaceae bacterium]|nr:MmcQ/YjbR family DNA-binding protein [Dermatophilaceae bacterium]